MMMSAQKSQKHAQCTQMKAQVIHSERKRDSATNIKKEYVRHVSPWHNFVPKRL